MRFAEANEQFTRFLRDQGHCDPIVWITPSDLLWWGSALLIRPRPEATVETERMFNEATEKGYGVALEAVARLDHRICCFVFAPDDPEDAASHFVAPPITMKVRQELRSAEKPGTFQWWLARKIASKRTHVRALQFFGYELDRRQRVVAG